MSRHILRSACVLALLTVFATSCGSQRTSSESATTPSIATPAAITRATGTLGALPKDGVQPWEELNADNCVIPSANRGASGLTQYSDFTAGGQRFLESSGVTDNSGASHLAPAAGELAFAMYRVSLGAVDQPGTVTVDANLAGGAEYYVALSDYAGKRWEWHGPFIDAQVALSVKSGDYTSALGNAFIAVATFDAAVIDVVGVGLNIRDISDTLAPPVPAAPTATVMSGGVELGWTGVIAADLAGYRICYSYSPFTSLTDNGVQSVPYLEDSTRFLLPRNSRRTTYIALSAVDLTGNASALSPVVTVTPTSGTLPQLSVSTSLISGGLNDVATLTVSGAESYDFDLDGDGVFEVTGSTATTQPIDTSAIGLIRPRVRGSNGGGTSVAFGSVSLIISGNQPPVAVAIADTYSGIVPLEVTFTGASSTDPDGTITEYAWDGDADGIYESATADPGFGPVTYASGGHTFNARLRVTDDQGAWDVDSIAIGALDPKVTFSITPSVQQYGQPVTFDIEAEGAPVTYDLDFESDGTYDSLDNPPPFGAFPWGGDPPGNYTATVRVKYSDIVSYTVSASYTISGWRIGENITAGNGGYQSALYGLGGGRAGIVFGGAGGLQFIRSNADLATWDPPVVINATGGSFISGKLVGGKPAAAFRGPGGLSYANASNAQGTAWDAVQVIDPQADAGYDASLVVVNGNPAICYTAGATAALWYVRATNAQGTAWGAPVEVYSGAGGVGYYCCLAVVNGFPAISFLNVNNVNFVRGGDTNGQTWNTPVQASPYPMRSTPTALVSVHGFPGIGFCSQSDGPVFVVADDQSGTAWTRPPQLLDPGLAGNSRSMAGALVGGVPTLTYTDASRQAQVVARAQDYNALSWKLDYIGQVALTSLEGRPGLSTVGNGVGLSYGISSGGDKMNFAKWF